MSALYNIPSVPHYIPPPPPSFKCGNFSMPTPPPGINIQINNCTGAYTGYIYQLYRGGAQGISTVQRGCTGYIDCTEGVHRVYRLYRGVHREYRLYRGVHRVYRLYRGVHRVYRLYRGVHRVYRRYRGVHKGLFHCTRVCFGSIDLKGELYGFMDTKG